jgi:hypothetical protein
VHRIPATVIAGFLGAGKTDRAAIAAVSAG